MKLLIVTQKVDRTDPILGFFHRWIEEFAKHCEQVTVIGQGVSDHQLPSNVRIESLRKESGASKISQVLRFWKLQWSLRKEYDAVLVHMTPIWIVLGGFFWMLLLKRMYLWYEAKGGGIALTCALPFVQKVLSASYSSAATRSHKSIVTGHGIDCEEFKPSGDRDANAIITVGRITRAKRLDVILECMTKLPEQYHLLIAGIPMTHEDGYVLRDCNAFIAAHNLSSRVQIQSLSPDELRSQLQKASLMLHASETTLDKAVLEAMASGCLVVSSSDAFAPILPDQCCCKAKNMAEVSQKLLSESSNDLREHLRGIVQRDHNITNLITRLVEEMK